MTISTIETKEFIDYVYSFYGSHDAIYPLRHTVYDYRLTKDDIKVAFKVYQNHLNFYKNWTWGGGDSLDRERVRDILETMYQFKEESKND